jgi:hypothetical protein
MWRLLRRLLNERRSLVVLDAMTYRRGLSKAAREGKPRTTFNGWRASRSSIRTILFKRI